MVVFGQLFFIGEKFRSFNIPKTEEYFALTMRYQPSVHQESFKHIDHFTTDSFSTHDPKILSPNIKVKGDSFFNPLVPKGSPFDK